MTSRINDFQTIRSQGGLLPPDLLRRVLDPKEKLDGTRPEDYGLPQGERLNEVITQSWSRLRKHWAEFRSAAEELPKDEPGTGLTNDKWSLPVLRELGFGLLPTGAGPQINGHSYAVNRFFGPVPIHLVGCGLSLDRRQAGARGAAAANPHGLVQEFLNRSPGHLWAIVSNGLRFRVLRDSQTLSRQSFLEFDLQAMFDGEVYSDFVLLWLMAHATRFAPREGERPDTCWLELWTKEADEQGTRALGDLRSGVERALQILGEGFTSRPKNTELRDALRSGKVTPQDFHGQLLRVVYRLIFLFVAEDRILDSLPLLHPRDDSEAARHARGRYAAHYSTGRLRDLAGKIKGSRHGDLWQQFQLVARALSGDPSFAKIREHLALPALGSFLWDPSSTAALNAAELTNHDFLEALRHLAFTHQGKVLRPVDYRNLGAEELGGVYESLLALTPQISADGARFTFAEFAGNERKTSGSYYTPDSLVQCLLDSALDPVVEETIKGKTGVEAEKAILALKVCDPAVGSGHFLVGAAHRLARHLARVRALTQGESEPSPLLYQHALRDVIGRCLYGVDLNPMAAELCRVSLWLEALEPGKPLSFLDHHIRVGNSLLGATPELIAAGLPDEAFTAIEGDDKNVCAALKQRNKKEREGQRDMAHLMVAEPQAEYNSIEARTRGIDESPDATLDDIQKKADQFRRLVVSPEYIHAQLVADAWCGAFVWKKQPRMPFEPVTTDTIRRLLADQDALTPEQRNELDRLSGQYQFFHWQLSYPEVFATGGFDCVLGNPPWERVKLQEKEWFAEGSPEIANAPNSAARKRMIDELKTGNPSLYQQFHDDTRKAEGESHLLRNTGRYPLCGRGDINTYAVFAEAMRNLLGPTGRVGCVLPTGIATDDTTKFFFQDVVEKQSLVSLFDFENKGIFFPGVHSSYKFCLFTTGRGLRASTETAEFVFFAHAVEDLRDPDRRFTLSAEDIARLNPNTRTCPIFRFRRDAELTTAIYRRTTVVGQKQSSGGWGAEYLLKLVDPTIHRNLLLRASDSPLVRDGIEGMACSGIGVLPLYEGKQIYHFDHRYATFNDEEESRVVLVDEKLQPGFFTMPRYWLSDGDFETRLQGRPIHYQGVLSVRDITNVTNERTVVTAIRPFTPALNSLGNLFCRSAADALFLCACLNSYAGDYVARQKIGGTHMSPFYLMQLAGVSPPDACSCAQWAHLEGLRRWVERRALELSYTAWDLEPFAQDCGWSGPPFRWEEERRFLLRCELDAAFFHLYLPATPEGEWKRALVLEGVARDESEEDLTRLKANFPTPRDAVAYIMDTFPIVRRKDEEKYNGDYRTKRVILEIYDAMQEAIRTGKPYQSRLAPPPADPRCCHPPRAVVAVVESAQSIPFRRVRPTWDERYKTCVPLVSLKAAAGDFSNDQRPEFDEWVEIKASQRLIKGMFVAQVVGKSMEPLIKDGAYCLFQSKAPQLENDMIGLFQLHQADDPEHGGGYTVKRLKLSTRTDPEEGWQRVATLMPENPAFDSISVNGEDVTFIAEFLEVLRP